MKYDQMGIFGRLNRKADSHSEIQNHTSIFLSEAPVENNALVATTGAPNCDSLNRSSRGAVDLGILVEQAEKKWESI